MVTARERRAGQAAGHQPAIAHLGCSDLVGPALGTVRDRARHRAQQGVGGGGKPGQLDIDVMVMTQMGALVGQKHLTFIGIERGQHGGTHDDTSGRAGDGEGRGHGVLDHHQTGVSWAEPAAVRRCARQVARGTQETANGRNQQNEDDDRGDGSHSRRESRHQPVGRSAAAGRCLHDAHAEQSGHGEHQAGHGCDAQREGRTDAHERRGWQPAAEPSAGQKRQQSQQDRHISPSAHGAGRSWVGSAVSALLGAGSSRPATESSRASTCSSLGSRSATKRRRTLA